MKYFRYIFLVVFLYTIVLYGKTIYIKEYVRKDGTKVAAHTRTIPDQPEARIFPKSMKQRAYKAQKGRCKHCGKFYSINYMEADHIIPYSKGGKTVYSNLQILCRPCNRYKGNRFSH